MLAPVGGSTRVPVREPVPRTGWREVESTRNEAQKWFPSEWFPTGTRESEAVRNHFQPEICGVELVLAPRWFPGCDSDRNLAVPRPQLFMARRLPKALPAKATEIEEREIFVKLMKLAPERYAEAQRLLQDAPSPVAKRVLEALNAYWKALGDLDAHCQHLEGT